MTATNQNESRAKNLTIDYSAPLKPTEEAKVGQIQAELDLLTRDIEYVSNMASKINKALEPILADRLTPLSPEQTSEDDRLCELARRLRCNRVALSLIADILGSINQRIEL